jgi:sarcosine oxidase gamma subunit
MIAFQEITTASLYRIALRQGGDRVGDVAGLPLPDAPGSAVHSLSRSALRLGPETWLVLDRNGGSFDEAGPMLVVEETGAWRVFALVGESALDLIARFSPADVRDFRDTCVATHAAGHPVILLPASPDRIELLVARSYADSLLDLFGNALERG